MSKMKTFPSISDECKGAFDNLSSLNIKNCQDFDALAKAIGYTDESFVNFLKDVSYSEKTLENYQKYITSTTKFGTTLASIGANVGIMLAINIAIQAISSAWDYLKVTVAESQEKIEQINSRLNELKTYKAELEDRNPASLSNTEKEYLTYLDDRIAKEEKLFKIQQARTAEERIGGKFTDLFDSDSYSSKLYQEKHGDWTSQLLGFLLPGYNAFTFDETFGGFSLKTTAELNKYNNLVSDISFWEAELKKYDKDSYDYMIASTNLEGKEAELADYNYSNANNLLGDWLLKEDSYEKAIAQLEEDQKSPYLSSDAYNEVENKIEEYKKLLTTAQKYIGELNTLLNSPQSVEASIDETLDRYTAKDLKSNGFTDNDLKILVGCSYDKDASLEDLRSLIDAEQAEINGNPIVITTLTEALNYSASDENGNPVTSSLNTKITEYRNSKEELDNYLSKIDNGSFDADDALNLAQKFGIAGDSVDDTKEKIEVLEDENLNAIITQLHDMINNVSDEGTKEQLQALEKQLKNLQTADTQYPFEKVHSLSEGFSQLSSIYDDISNKGDFDWSSILNSDSFKTTFGNIEDTTISKVVSSTAV